MRSRSAWTLWGSVVAVCILAAAISWAATDGEQAQSRLSLELALLVYATVGVVVVTRRSGHAIGRIYVLGATAGVFGQLASAWVVLDRSTTAALPLTGAARLLDDVLFTVPFLVLIAPPLLLFPDGKPRSPRWRAVLRIQLVAITLVGAAWTFRPGFLDDARTQTNPLGIPGAKPVMDAFNAIGLLTVGATVVATIVSLFVRYRHASGVERQQLKWLGWAGVWTIVLLFSSGPGYYGGMLPGFIRVVIGPVIAFVFAFALSMIPLSVAVAVLRYRLWDIDRVVSRTVTYALVTALIAGMYAIPVVLVPSMFLGTRHAPDWLIAAATLMAAGAFVPVRQRIQDVVDRRFNRTRYDAQRTVDAFAARLREQIDLDALAVELESVVDRTVHPSHLFLWVPRA